MLLAPGHTGKTSDPVGRSWELRLPRFRSWLCSLLALWPLGGTAAHNHVSYLDSGDNNSTPFVLCGEDHVI